MNVPEVFVNHERDYSFSAEQLEWMNTMDSDPDNPVGPYFGRPDVQGPIIAEINAADRIKREHPWTFEALQAADRISSIVKRTPLVQINDLVPEAEVPIYGKLEIFQHTDQFKLRGMANAVLALTPEQREAGVYIRSAGNAALGLAYVCNLFGIPLDEFMPESASPVKVQKNRNLNARVHLEGEDYDGTGAPAIRFHKKHPDTTEIYAFDSKYVAAGQATILIEALQEHPEIRTSFWQGGGGGLAAVNAAVAKEFDPNSRVYVTQLEGSDALYQSCIQGRPVRLSHPANPRSDGTAVREPGKFTVPMINRFVDGFNVVTEIELARAQVDASEYFDTHVEAPGALALAGLRQRARRLTSPTLVTFTGRNCSQESWEWAVRLTQDALVAA